MNLDSAEMIKQLKEDYPKKFISEYRAFRQIPSGASIFIGTACGEPQYLVQALTNHVEQNPSHIIDAEVLHVWTLDKAPFTDARLRYNFRHNSFFIGNSTRRAVNEGTADYTPVFLSHLPDLFYRNLVQVDVVLVQTSLPDEHGYVSLGISVDVTKAAVENAQLIIVQMNAHMPRIHGDGFLHLNDIDCIIPYDEPLLEDVLPADDEVARQIGKYVSRLIEDGDTLQVGYGTIPNAILPHLYEKKHLGVHTELLSVGLVSLMMAGVVDNSRKTANPGRTVATYCMGNRETYKFLHDNPTVEFRTADYTNNPLVIARHDNMTVIDSALELDLTGQSTSESLGRVFCSGIGGQADFMRGAMLAKNGKTIVALRSTAENDTISKIVPLLKTGAGVTLNRGDLHYVVTEYGIAYIHGKSIRERAMALIGLANPSFRPWLIEEAKRLNLIYKDQVYMPGKRGEYPANVETTRTTKTGLELFLRPVKISDEALLKDFFYGMSNDSLYNRFMRVLKGMPHERLQEFAVIDYTRDMVLLAINKGSEEQEEVVGIGQYNLNEGSHHMADAAFAVKDSSQGQGIGRVLLQYLTHLAKKQGLRGFTADTLFGNHSMLHLFNSMGFDVTQNVDSGAYHLTMKFRKSSSSTEYYIEKR